MREALALVPDRRVDEGLLSWLEQGIGDGKANSGAFIYSGTMRKGAPREINSMRLMLDVEDVELSYHQDWPVLTGLSSVVEVTQESAEIRATQGRLLDLEFDRLDVSWRSGETRNVAKVTSHVRGSAADGIKLLTDTPVRDALFDLIDDFEATGEIDADIDLEIPLGEGLQPKVNLSLQATDVQLEIPSLGLTFADIGGRFEYDTEKGMSCEGGSASLFNQPVAINVSSTFGLPADGAAANVNVPYTTKMVMSGEIDAESLYAWEPLAIFTRIYGKTDYEAVLTVSGSETASDTLIVTSDLEGITFDAPEPFGKVAAENSSLRYEIELDDTQIHRLGYADLLQTALVMEEGSYDRGEVRLGPEPANFEDLPGISVRGTVEQLRILDWWDFFAQLDSVDAERAKAQGTNRAESEADGVRDQSC